MRFGSLFSGIGGFDLGFERAGMECAWQVEIDKPCLGVLERHWPGARRYTDVKEVGRNLEPVDLICGGFPCQDLSVAGRREGLAGERSGLWFEYHRILEEVRPKWVVVENVPGLLSSHGGQDFAVLLRGLVELGYGVSWRVLDSQYFGVPQRRRRVFIVGSLGDGRSAEVLFERESSLGDTAPSREAGQRVALAIAGGSDKAHGDISSGNQDGNLIAYPDPSYSVQGNGSKFGSGRHNQDTFVAFSPFSHYGYEEAEQSATIHNYRQLSGSENMVVQAQPIPINTMAATRPESAEENRQTFGVGEPGDPMFTLQENHQHAVAQQVQWASGGGEVLNDTAQSLRSGAEHNYQFVYENQKGEVWLSDTGNLQGQGGKPGQGYPAITWHNKQSAGEVRVQGDTSPSDTRAWGTGGNQGLYVGVRRLTPTECERLQSFPDGWTDGQSDSARYRQLGNAVTVNVIEWIGRRIMEVINA